MQITLRLALRAEPAALEIIKATMRQYTESYNRVVALGWKERITNSVELHRISYGVERQRTSLPSQLVCSARVKACESLKSVAGRIRKGRKSNMPVSQTCAMRYDARSMS